jgi:hypothetical protein
MEGARAKLDTLLGSGLAVDVALVVIALEFAVLLARAPKGQKATRALDLVCALGPGACLMLALRAALTGAGGLWVVVWLSLSLPLHVADMARRRF